MLRRPDLAELQRRLAPTEKPCYVDAWRGLVETLVDQQKYVTLSVEIEKAKGKCAVADEELAAAEARLYRAQGMQEAVCTVVDEAVRRLGDRATRLRLKCQMLFEGGQPSLALEALETLCQLDPDRGGELAQSGHGSPSGAAASSRSNVLSTIPGSSARLHPHPLAARPRKLCLG